MSDSSARMDQLDNEQFEKQAADLRRPTTVRPALFAEDEITRIREGYATGSGRLAVLNQVRIVREAYLVEQSGEKPFDPLNDGDRAKAAAFFAAHGTRLASEPRVAPPNPIRREQTQAEASASLDRAMANVGKPAEENATAYQARMQGAANPWNVDAEPSAAAAADGSSRPMPEQVRGLAVAPPPASLEIEFLSVQGFACRLTLAAVTGLAVLESGKAAMALLEKMGAKAAPTPAPAVVVQPPAGDDDAVSDDNPPKCKYHGAMKPSRKPGGWFCPKKLADGTYCDQKVGGD